MRFHARLNVPVIPPVERCRRNMHIAAVAANTLSVAFFVMVIRHEFRGAIVMLAMTASPISICGAVSAGRMWIYT